MVQRLNDKQCLYVHMLLKNEGRTDGRKNKRVNMRITIAENMERKWEIKTYRHEEMKQRNAVLSTLL